MIEASITQAPAAARAETLDEAKARLAGADDNRRWAGRPALATPLSAPGRAPWREPTPLEVLTRRLYVIDQRLAGLRMLRDRRGDALAARLIPQIVSERDQLLIELAAIAP